MKNIIVLLFLILLGFTSIVKAETLPEGVKIVVPGDLIWIEQGSILFIYCDFNPLKTCFEAIVIKITYPDGSIRTAYDLEMDGVHYIVRNIYSTSENEYEMTLNE